MDVLFYISEFHFLFLLIFILFSLSSGDGSFFSLTRVLTVGKYADTTSVLFSGDFGKLLINCPMLHCSLRSRNCLLNFRLIPTLPVSVSLNVFIRILVSCSATLFYRR